jgi:hypothetical protein
MVRYQKWMSRSPSVTVRTTTTGALSCGPDLAAAARIIADKARELAGAWSRQIPPAITVSVSGKVATIECQVGPAYPNEIEGVRHPVFAHGPDRREWTWVTNQYRPFLAPAADAASDAAMRRYADKIDGWARKAGYK